MHHFELGYQYFCERRIREAVKHFRQGLASGEDPEQAARDRWMTMMLAGEFEDAWLESDRVLQRRICTGETCAHLPLHMRFVWTGKPLSGRDVLVRCYHGLGDVVQFIRYCAVLKSMCRRVRVQASPVLLEVLRGVAGIDELHSLEAADPEFEIDIELLELPHALRTTLDSIPAQIPYIRIEPDRVKQKSRALAAEKRFRAGLVWASGVWRPERSLPLSCFSFLAEMKNVAVIGLQRGPAVADVKHSAIQFVHSEWNNDSIVDTAATILNLDLVVSTDTMTAHLAGALGVPTWLLLHTDSDWRWMVEREDSPWYPSMRLFRQTRSGDWQDVTQRVEAGIAAGLSSHYQREGLRP